MAIEENRDFREILMFLNDEMKVLEHFIRDFCLWELIHETGVKNSGIKSRMQYEIELRSASLPNRSSDRVVD